MPCLVQPSSDLFPDHMDITCGKDDDSQFNRNYRSNENSQLDDNYQPDGERGLHIIQSAMIARTKTGLCPKVLVDPVMLQEP